MSVLGVGYPYNCPEARIRHLRKCPCERCQRLANEAEEKLRNKNKEIKK